MGERSQRAEQEGNRIKTWRIEELGERMADERRVEREDSWREWKKKATMLSASFKEKERESPLSQVFWETPRFTVDTNENQRENKKTRFPDGACQDVEKAEK